MHEASLSHAVGLWDLIHVSGTISCFHLGSDNLGYHHWWQSWCHNAVGTMQLSLEHVSNNVGMYAHIACRAQ